MLHEVGEAAIVSFLSDIELHTVLQNRLLLVISPSRTVAIVLHAVLVGIEELDKSVGWIVLLRMLLRTSAVVRMMDATAYHAAHFHRAATHVMLTAELRLLMVLQRMVVVMMVMM